MTDEEIIKRLEKKVAALEIKVKSYEENGPAKLYYSLNRKSWEMADLLNETALKELDLEDKNSKKFERIQKVWNDSTSVATAVKTLADSIGVSGDEIKDISRKPSFLDKMIS